MKPKLQVSRLLALHVLVPRIEILENFCFHVGGSDVFASLNFDKHFCVCAFVSFSNVIESKLACATCCITTQLFSVCFCGVPYQSSTSMAQWHRDVIFCPVITIYMRC